MRGRQRTRRRRRHAQLRDRLTRQIQCHQLDAARLTCDPARRALHHKYFQPVASTGFADNGQRIAPRQARHHLKPRVRAEAHIERFAGHDGVRCRSRRVARLGRRCDRDRRRGRRCRCSGVRRHWGCRGCRRDRRWWGRCRRRSGPLSRRLFRRNRNGHGGRRPAPARCKDQQYREQQDPTSSVFHKDLGFITAPHLRNRMIVSQIAKRSVIPYPR